MAQYRTDFLKKYFRKTVDDVKILLSKFKHYSFREFSYHILIVSPNRKCNFTEITMQGQQ